MYQRFKLIFYVAGRGLSTDRKESRFSVGASRLAYARDKFGHNDKSRPLNSTPKVFCKQVQGCTEESLIQVLGLPQEKMRAVLGIDLLRSLAKASELVEEAGKVPFRLPDDNTGEVVDEQIMEPFRSCDGPESLSPWWTEEEY
jgi:hypothetical protein